MCESLFEPRVLILRFPPYGLPSTPHQERSVLLYKIY